MSNGQAIALGRSIVARDGERLGLSESMIIGIWERNPTAYAVMIRRREDAILAQMTAPPSGNVVFQWTHVCRGFAIWVPWRGRRLRLMYLVFVRLFNRWVLARMWVPHV